jgi:3',5'-cyclic AMP phosphodiesterase CpdA
LARPFVIAHASDLHVSTFGDTFHDRAHIVKRSARLADTSDARWTTAWEEGGWRVLREKKGRRAKIELVDPEGYSHPVPSLRESGGVVDPVERAAAKACRLEARRAKTLANGLPSEGALDVLQQTTPANSNLRFLRAARVLESDGADAILLTGDLTDDGDGYELIEAAFAKWKAKGRLFAVPGNHDTYLFPLLGSARPRPSADGKRAAWRAFAERPLGCRSGDMPSFWRVELAEHAHASRVRIPVAAIEQENDPEEAAGTPEENA